MYVLYLDESGKDDSWTEHNNFVIGGVAVHEGQVAGLVAALDSVQQEFFPGVDAPLHFHAVDIFKGKDKFRELGPERQTELLKRLYTKIGEQPFPNLTAFATTIDISAVNQSTQVLKVVFEDVITRFNTFMARQHKLGHPTKGLVIIDQAHKDKYKAMFREFRVGGTRFGSVNNVVDIPYFAGRKDTRMLQVADLIAYAAFQYFEHQDATFIDLIKEKFNKRSAYGPLDGFKHITNDSGCKCYACNWRQERNTFRQY